MRKEIAVPSGWRVGVPWRGVDEPKVHQDRVAGSRQVEGGLPALPSGLVETDQPRQDAGLKRFAGDLKLTRGRRSSLGKRHKGNGASKGMVLSAHREAAILAP